MDAAEVRRLEAAARRPLGPAVLHPDRCPKLTLHGVAFAVPPLRRAEEMSFVPVFGPQGLALQLQDGGSGDPELLREAREIVAALPAFRQQPCPACGRPRQTLLEIDPRRQQAFLSRLAAYAAALLRRQYVLSDDDLSRLLAFSADRVPAWLHQVIRHASDLPPEPPESPGGPARPAAAPRRWWQWWK